MCTDPRHQSIKGQSPTTLSLSRSVCQCWQNFLPCPRVHVTIVTYHSIFIFVCFNTQYKERDFLESIFKFWRNRDEKYFDVAKLWWVNIIFNCLYYIKCRKQYIYCNTIVFLVDRNSYYYLYTYYVSDASCCVRIGSIAWGSTWVNGTTPGVGRSIGTTTCTSPTWY